MATHAEVAHRWAQDDRSARTVTGFNLFYDWSPSYPAFFEAGSWESVIYSHGYHFPLAAFQTTKAGRRVVLANLSERRSISTTAHQSEVRSAIPSRYEVFDVPYVSPRHKPGGAEHFHRDNLDALLERAAEANAKAKRARKYSAFHTEDAMSALNTAMRYAEAFELDWTAPDLDALTAEVQRREAERAAEYRREREEREAALRERERQRRIDDAERFEAWRRGEGYHCPGSYAADPETGSVYLRRHQDGETDELQTSRGASVPWAHALKVFRFIKQVRDTGQGFKANGRVIRVGHYHVDSIDAEGNMHAGCHYFAWTEIESLAKREGVFDSEPSAEAVETHQHALAI